MDQNTAPNNNIQFQYPSFPSGDGNQATTPTPASPSTPTAPTSNDNKSMEDLRKSLDELISNDQQISAPVAEQPLPQENTYTQEPTPLPSLDSSPSSSSFDLKDIANSIQPPPIDAFSPLPSDLPKLRESLDSIMPDTKKPRAMERDPKSDNLSKPVQKAPSRTDDITRNDSLKSPNTISDSVLSIERLLSEAINRNASDLHIAVGYPPIVRIDGELLDLDEKVLNPEDAEGLIFSVLSDEKKELLEVNREIDFAYTFQGANNARFRVNAYYSMKNLSAAFRLIPSRIRTVEELMLPQMYHQFAKLKQGLILVTGPTGHGKSTTLAAILEDINRTRFCHIVTIEDPIEYVFEGKKSLIDQREMNDDTHSWNIALRSALRQDPDVILVGEMRDFETISSAITLAETGHLVFATLHTNSASQTLDRIVDVFPENQQQQVRTQIANTLEAVIAQRLIPLEKGGRRAVSEIMLNNSAVSNLIREGKMYQIDNVIRTSSDIGMVYLEKSLVGLVREGVISLQRAQEYAVHPEEVLRLLKS